MVSGHSSGKPIKVKPTFFFIFMPQDSFELKNIYVDKDTIFNTERLDELHDVELRVLGNDFLEAERIKTSTNQ